jgi:hypothetical protein
VTPRTYTCELCACDLGLLPKRFCRLCADVLSIRDPELRDRLADERRLS